MDPSLMITDPTTRSTLTPPQCLNGFRVDGHLWGQKGTNGYSYVLILPRMMQKCIPALRVISMACSYSGGHVLEFSHSLYCPGLEDKRKRDWVLLYNKEDQENKVSLIFFFFPWGHLSLTVIVATPIAVITSRVVIVAAIAAISVALLSVAVVLVVSLVPVVVVTLIPVLALA